MRVEAEAFDVVCRADEREGDHVDLVSEEEFDRTEVLGSGRREGEPISGDVESRPAREDTAMDDRGGDPVAFQVTHLEDHPAVTDAHATTRFDVGEECLVVDLDDSRPAPEVADPQLHRGSLSELDGVVAEAGSTNLGPRQVDEDAHRAVLLGGEAANRRQALSVLLEGTVRHPEAGHVHPGADQAAQHRLTIGGGPDRRDDLGAPGHCDTLPARPNCLSGRPTGLASARAPAYVRTPTPVS